MTTIMEKAERAWEVKLPPIKKHMVAGKLMPTVRGAFGFHKKKRRLVMEVLGPVLEGDDDAPRSTQNVGDLCQLLEHDEDRVVVRILKPRKHWGLSRDSDDSDDDDDEPGMSDEDEGFVEYRKYELGEITEMRVSGKELEATFGVGSAMEVREIHFESKDTCRECHAQIVALQKHAEDRASQRLEAFRQKQQDDKKSEDSATTTVQSRDINLNNSPDDDIQLLVEIVSCVNLPIADISSTDPYMTVFFGTKEVHRTQPISKTTNPIWTVDNGSLFVLTKPTDDFFKTASGLTFYIKDYDGLSNNETIGTVVLSQQELLKLDGKRVEYDIRTTAEFSKRASRLSPKLVLRVRKAQASDVQFMKTLFQVKKQKKTGVYLEESFCAPKATSVKLLKRESKKGDAGELLYRIKPCPDPSRPEAETKWMAKERIDTEHLLPSTHWIEAGSGKLGKLYFEVLRCEGLPNMDTGIGSGTTDAFCALVYEDAIVNTDVINDETNPRWMPWSQRAFCFHIQHPSSQVLLGVLDYDSSKGVNSHDAIGRISIDITNFRGDTDYVLTYDLHRSVLNEDRPKEGKITVRLRIEWKNYRNVVLSAIGAPPFNYVNVGSKNEFKTTYYVCNGDENVQQLNMDALKNYGNELSSYTSVPYTIVDALKVIFLWRGHFPVNVCGLKFSLPIHSVIAFVMGITLIENFNLFPSYWLFTIAWFLLATNEHRQRNPSPWHGSMTFREMWYAFIAGKSPPKEIADHENEAAVRKYEEAKEVRRQQIANDKARAEEAAKKMNQFLTNEDMEDEAVDADISTQVQGGQPLSGLNPLKPILLPIQITLAMICKALRIVTSIITWDDSQYAFVLTNLCLFASLAIIWVPWDFVLRWTARVVIWVLMGPWMKLVDIFYARKLEEEGDNEAKQFKRLANERLSTIAATKRAIMTKKEDILKLSALKRYMFGKFVTRVPQFKQDRFQDMPLAESTATPHSGAQNTVAIAEKKHGQLLVGHMVPKWADASDEQAAAIE